MILFCCSLAADELLETHRDWRVVELDVERLLKRYPPDLSVDQRKALEASLKRIIMRTLYGTDCYYYQGFHDIAITIQLVLDDEDSKKLSSIFFVGCLC